MADEKNPNHPVTATVREQWHKIAALLVHKTGKRQVVITPQELAKMVNDPAGTNITIKIDDVKGITLTLVTDAEAERLAREEGGLPA